MIRALALACLCCALAACDRPELPARSDARLNIYNWVDEVGPRTYPEFERRTGIDVNSEALTSGQVLETRLLAGHSGFDIVAPGAHFLPRLTAAGALLPLDKSRLPNLRNLDPAILKRLEALDPGNRYGVPYVWGTNGIGMNTDAVTAALGAPPPRSWRLLFDPAFASRLQRCGIVWLESSWTMTNYALLSLGLDPNSESEQDLQAVERTLTDAFPFVRYLDNYRGDRDLVSGEICIEPAGSGSILQARARAAEVGSPVNLEYFVPEEGAMLWFDMLAIPADAPHLDAAYRFLNYILEPEVIAEVTNTTRFANAVPASQPYIAAELRGDPAIYPAPETFARLHMDRAESPAYTRLENRMWDRVRAGRN